MLDKRDNLYRRKAYRIKKRKERRIIKKIVLISLVAILITISLIIGVTKLLNSNEKKVVKVEKKESFTFNGSKLETKSVLVSTVKDNKRLLLIDDKHIVPEYEEEEAIKKFDLVEAYPKLPVKSSNLFIEKVTFENTVGWIKTSMESGFFDLIIISGYRSYEDQKLLYEESVDKDFVQTPGSSEHNMGIAIDFIAEGVLDEDLASTNEGKWLKETANQFGFILRYPDNKKNITKINYEPWHFRYVGRPHSDIIKSENIVLEEYLKKLKKNKTLVYEDGENKYWIYYVKEKKGKVLIPKDKNYEISSDNSGGYIITIKK